VVDLAGWVASLDAVVDLIAGRFGRVEPHRWVGAYLRGLLAGLERKNGWTLAEHAGMAQGWARKWWVTCCAGIPSRRRRSCSRSGASSLTRRDTRFRPLMSCGRPAHLIRSIILVRAPRVPVPTGTRGESPTMTGRTSLTVHGQAPQLMARDGPFLCKAVLDSLIEPAPDKKCPRRAGRSPG
jgi:hypothetical protein